nr:probable G-protein coupled receptor 149 [Zootoca vivipara]
MSVTLSNVSSNGTSHHGIMDIPKGQKPLNLFLFCLTFIITFTTLLGSIYSLVSLLRMQSKSTVSMLVTSLTVDDLISVAPATIFMLKHWLDEMLPQTLCTASALLYLFQGFSSNLMGSLIVSYNFYSLSKMGTGQGATKRPVSMVWAVLTIWIVSLLICILPLCGWGSYASTPWGCLTDCTSSYILFLFIVYSLCFCLLLVLSIPLIYQLLCSDEQQHLYDDYHQIARGYFSPGSPPTGGRHTPSLSPEDTLSKTLKHFQGTCPNADLKVRQSPVDHYGLDRYGMQEGPYNSRTLTVEFAQKRFSLILALTKVTLWLPMMIQMVVQHTVGFQSLSFEIFSFLLTLLAVTVTPVFVLSEHWSHLPCGCIINCRRNVYTVSSEEGKKYCPTQNTDVILTTTADIHCRSGGSLAIPLCAFQGTVSLHAPTGKTLSLSTYEVSTEGQKITPTSKKIEVYRSKSVGHEPNPEDSPTTFADTSVKIHLEVLEICDNEEALDTVSIISNISQSSTQVRSPSLRYSRKENRFVSCDLGETASYSLFIPSNNPNNDINISIPDTVEAHRQNSKKQHMEKEGYQEEIQMLNKAYRKREESGASN